MASTFVIGDIHGCNETLLQLLDKIGPIPPDARIVFLGDYIDRGPQSKKVVETVLRIRADHPNTITLMGNHERMLINYINGTDTKTYLRFGGIATLESYGIAHEDDPAQLLPEDHIRFFNELLLYWEEDNFIFAHAGIDPEMPMALQSERWLLWFREDNKHPPQKEPDKTVIYGHTAFKIPKVGPNKIGIDTGAVYGGNLTCLLLPEKKFIQVKGQKFWPGLDQQSSR